MTTEPDTQRGLWESHERFRLAFEDAPIGQALIGMDGRLEQVNQAMCDLTGYAGRQLRRLTIADLIHPDDLAADQVYAAKLQSGDLDTYTSDQRYVRADGTVVWVAKSVSLVRGPDATPVQLIVQSNDITDRKRYEQLVEDSRRLQEAQSISHVGSWELDPQTSRTTLSAGLLELYGLDPTTHAENHPTTLGMVHPDDRAAVQSAITACITTGEAMRIRYRLTRADDGVLRWFEARAVAVLADGCATRLAGAVVDVTDEVLAAQARERDHAASVERERALAEAQHLAETGSWSWDLITNQLTWSPELYVITGIDPVGYEPSFVALSELVHPADKDLLVQAVRDALATGESYELDYRVTRPDGVERIIRSQARIEHLPDGAPARIVGIARDVTEARHAAQQLAQARDLYSGVLDAATEQSIIGTDLTGQITVFNVGAQRMLGYSRDEMLGETVERLHRADEVVERAIELGIDAGFGALVHIPTEQRRSETRQWTYLTRDGGELQVMLTVSAMYSTAGIVTGYIGVATDVTVQRHAEAALAENIAARKHAEDVLLLRDLAERAKLTKKNAELESHGRAKDAFVASMSHELRTPLNAIIGFTGTLLMELPGPLNEEQARQLRTVEQSGKHLLAIINDILDVASIESGAVQPILESVDCVELVAQVGATLRPLAAEKGLELIVDLPGEDVVVETDHRALTQVLINFIANAIKFTEEGRIQVTLVPRSAAPGGIPSISVADTGPGIGDADRSRIFEAFERGKAVVSTSKEGTGLGLYICVMLAELIGADVTFDTEEGVGTTFTIALERAST